ncbi:pre-mRNA-splicing factor Cwc22p [[Candida] jaroonii]|uniref:Pre-mRNA-splicing factor Cwc22p n=1 Tax=[Candida] jaroonii TaxID=467808 RepID=A0ACA9Y2X2_9ASCO|nr:pre-mRNA-splicing factor Cwc22p [[Candida] jaroonii]
MSDWIRLKQSVYLLIDNLNGDNLGEICCELLKLNLFRGKGIVVRKLIYNQQKYYQNTGIYANLISLLNSQIPEIGEIISNKLIINFKNEYLNDKFINIDFICELVNYKVINEMITLQILELLMNNMTNGSITIIIRIIKLNGLLLPQNVVYSIIDKLRNMMNEGLISESNQNGVKQLIGIRKRGFKNFAEVLIEGKCHMIDIEDDFKTFNELMIDNGNEYKEYEAFKDKFISNIEGLFQEPEVEPEAEVEEEPVIDLSQSELINLQKTVYLTIMSSLTSDEAVHKLLKLNYDPSILSNIIIRSCIEEKTYSKYYGNISEILILRFDKFKTQFMKQFEIKYKEIHLFELNGIRNLGKLFGYLIATNKLSIDILKVITLTEEDTNSSSRILIKFLLKEMIEELSLNDFKILMIENMNNLPGMFPIGGHKDDIIFAINYFTAIGLGLVTDELREDLSNARGRTRKRVRQESNSRSGSYSRSRSGSYSRSGSGSYSRSRSRSGSYSRSRSGSYSRSASYSRSPSRTPSRSPGR